MDLIHDGMTAMLTDAGAPSELLIGPEAALWSGGAIFPRKVSNGQDRLPATAVVVAKPDPRVTAYLSMDEPGAWREVGRVGGWDNVVQVDEVRVGADAIK